MRTPKIVYPRKCNHCDHLSNTPSSFYAHCLIHEPILEGTLCAFECNNPGRYRKSSGTITCEEESNNCPKLKDNQRLALAKYYETEEGKALKEKNRILGLSESAEHRKKRGIKYGKQKIF